MAAVTILASDLRALASDYSDTHRWQTREDLDVEHRLRLRVDSQQETKTGLVLMDLNALNLKILLLI